MHDPRKSSPGLFRPGLWGGLICVGFSAGPLLALDVLQRLGRVDPGNNGLGFGIWFAVTMPFALAALVLGILYDAKYPM